MALTVTLQYLCALSEAVEGRKLFPLQARGLLLRH